MPKDEPEPEIFICFHACSVMMRRAGVEEGSPGKVEIVVEPLCMCIHAIKEALSTGTPSTRDALFTAAGAKQTAEGVLEKAARMVGGRASKVEMCRRVSGFNS